jgi:hypothetical protein
VTHVNIPAAVDGKPNGSRDLRNGRGMKGIERETQPCTWGHVIRKAARTAKRPSHRRVCQMVRGEWEPPQQAHKITEIPQLETLLAHDASEDHPPVNQMCIGSCPCIIAMPVVLLTPRRAKRRDMKIPAW